MNQDNGERPLQVEEPRLEAPPVPISVRALFRAVRQGRRDAEDMAQYICKRCKELVRGGVITICGHIFCWTCLWPLVADKPSPECPMCHTGLFLHEDIVPFFGEGRNARPEDIDVVAEPGAVPRPSGICFTALPVDVIAHFAAVIVGPNPPPELAALALRIRRIQRAREERFQDFRREMWFSETEFIVQCLKWLQVICAIIILLLWGLFSVT